MVDRSQQNHLFDQNIVPLDTIQQDVPNIHLTFFTGPYNIDIM